MIRLSTKVAGALFAITAALSACADVHADADKPVVEFTTNLGPFTVELEPAKAPETVSNFLRLVDSGFYTDLIFHRVVQGFVVQAGGYDRHLVYKDPPRTVVNESRNGLSNTLGTLAMARLDDPDSADTQFFINLKDNTYLNGSTLRPGYTVFGRVTAGFPVIERIAAQPTSVQQGMTDVPVKPVVIQRAKRI